MAKRVFLLIPEGLNFEILPPLQQAAIKQVFGQYVMPMPSTMPVQGLQICDALTDDSFDPALMAQYGIDWEIIGIWQWSGEEQNAVENIVPLNVVKYIARLMEPNAEPHKWAGWPDCIVSN